MRLFKVDDSFYAFTDASCNKYLIKNASKYIMVDPGTKRDIKSIVKLTKHRDIKNHLNFSLEQIDSIILTHLHRDHSSGVQYLLDRSQAKLGIHREELNYSKTKKSKGNLCNGNSG